MSAGADFEWRFTSIVQTFWTRPESGEGTDRPEFYEEVFVPKDEETRVALILLYLLTYQWPRDSETLQHPADHLAWGLALVQAIAEGITPGNEYIAWDPTTLLYDCIIK